MCGRILRTSYTLIKNSLNTHENMLYLKSIKNYVQTQSEDMCMMQNRIEVIRHSSQATAVSLIELSYFFKGSLLPATRHVFPTQRERHFSSCITKSTQP